MGRAIQVLFKLVEIAVDEAVIFIKEKLKGGKNDTGNSKA